MSTRWVGVAVLLACATFLVLVTLAAAHYPGGTWLDRGRAGHSFWENFLCDLLHAHSLNGADNRVASRLSRAAMLAMAFALGAIWLVGPTLSPRRGHAALFCRALGGVALVATIALILLPSDRHPAAHAVAVIGATLGGTGATLALLLVLGAQPSARRLAALGWLAVGLAVGDLALYVSTQYGGAGLEVSTAAIQRIATLVAVGFAAAVGAGLVRQRKPRS